MTTTALEVVQFVHPGFEYRPKEHVRSRRQRSGVMPWKPGKSAHDRKFMLSRGSVYSYKTGRKTESVPLAFWGEWEGPSVFWMVDSPGKPMPSVIHAPFRPATPPSEPVQNTDPMVFGSSFVYSNCLQSAFRTLRQLSPGSIVLFGRHSRVRGVPSFAIDTCFVVDRAEPLLLEPFQGDSYGEDLLADAVSSPLYTEGAESEFRVYFGRAPRAGAQAFSFFPARLTSENPELFARPELRPVGPLRRIVNPAKNQGIKVTSDFSEADRDAIWTEVAQQVTEQGCELGYYVDPPPLLEESEADAVSRREPTVARRLA